MFSNKSPLILIFALALLFSSGNGTLPSTRTEKLTNFRTTNIRDNAFTISWVSAYPTIGEIYYSTERLNLNLVARDERGANIIDEIHYITLTGLVPETTYYFDIHSGGSVDDNNGDHYEITTGPTLGIPSLATGYGQVLKPDGITPGEQCIVYIYLSDNDGIGSLGQASPLSSLIEMDESGYWDSVLSNARQADLNAYFSYSPSGDNLELQARCGNEGTTDQIIDTANSAPAPAMILTIQEMMKIYLPLTINP